MEKFKSELKELLDNKANFYNNPSFIFNDPISIPHLFSIKQDIEIAGFFTALISWGNRTTIIKNSKRLVEMMDYSPYEFIKGHADNDLKPFQYFVHRTFNATDLLYCIAVLRQHYCKFNSLEDAFVTGKNYDENTVGQALINFHNYFFSTEHLSRTRKHIPTPLRNSACKRMNMYLRWMVRKDNKGVDFGLWNKIKPSQLICPLDIHVVNVAERLGLLQDKKSNFKNAMHLTTQLADFNPSDPVLYDFALFGMGVEKYF